MRILWGLILEKEKLILNKLKVVIESAWSYIYRGTRHDCRNQCLVCCESLRRTALFLFFATLDRSFRKSTSIFSFVGLIHNIFYKTYKQLISNNCKQQLPRKSWEQSTNVGVDRPTAPCHCPSSSGNACLLFSFSLSLSLSNCGWNPH